MENLEEGVDDKNQDIFRLLQATETNHDILIMLNEELEEITKLDDQEFEDKFQNDSFGIDLDFEMQLKVGRSLGLGEPIKYLHHTGYGTIFYLISDDSHTDDLCRLLRYVHLLDISYYIVDLMADNFIDTLYHLLNNYPLNSNGPLFLIEKVNAVQINMNSSNLNIYFEILKKGGEFSENCLEVIDMAFSNEQYSQLLEAAKKLKSVSIFDSFFAPNDKFSLQLTDECGIERLSFYYCWSISLYSLETLLTKAKDTKLFETLRQINISSTRISPEEIEPIATDLGYSIEFVTNAEW